MNDSIIKIAIAEDQQLVRKGIIALITDCSPHKVVVEAEHGEELIDKLSKLEFTPDVCLLDINMPVMNGYDTMIALRKMYPGMRCLVITMFETEFSVIVMIQNGARGYITKNRPIQELIEAIELVHTTGYYYSNIASEEVFNVIEKAKKMNYHLTEREIQFITLCCGELSYPKIANQMFASIRTVEDYHNKVCQKLHVKNRIGLVLFAISTGLVSLSNLQQNAVPPPLTLPLGIFSKSHLK